MHISELEVKALEIIMRSMPKRGYKQQTIIVLGDYFHSFLGQMFRNRTNANRK